VWIHGDLLRPNLLVRGGRLRAVIDFGAVGVGDPAADVIAHQAALIIPYYAETNPGLAASARRTVAQVLADTGP
jgi:aminoglycoside phosphotransferase (APT) family kinase protein